MLLVMRGLAPNFYSQSKDFGRFWPFVSKVAISTSPDEWPKLGTLVSFGVDLWAGQGGSHKSADARENIAADCSASAVLGRENSCK